MNDVLTSLLRLQALEFNETTEKDVEAQVADLRAKIPQPVLCHFDRLLARGKKGVAVVRNQTCSSCHMRLPIGTINTLMQGGDIRLCDTCGRYLYLPDPAASQFVDKLAAAKPVEQAAPKPVRKPRKPKALAPT
jgi:predicted  nucleic acid-binding Zn-ribbon protein